MKRFSLIILSLALLLSLTACGEATPEKVINKAKRFLKGIDNVHCSVISAMDITEDGHQITNFLSMEAKMDIKNGVHYMEMASDANGEETVVDLYADLGDTVDYYIGANDRWIKMPDVDPAKVTGMDMNADVTRDFDFYFEHLLESENTVMTEENLDGVECYKLYAPLPVKTPEIAKKLNLESFINAILGENPSTEARDYLFEVMGAVDITVYITRKGYQPYGFVVDSAPALSEFYHNIQNDKVTITEAYTSTVYTDYDKVGDIVIPEKVLNAPDMASVQAQVSAAKQ